ncbi:hypothetical protein F2Q70_00024776 [Brassica cretica]|uniref:Uncharacterized protein n=1 Tax=Brassica cretica TaxID=69181 RepID=A0A8S9LFT1_BRACR|nr:hypothetical protein F2Q70_00024776 [Brassica cretica]
MSTCKSDRSRILVIPREEAWRRASLTTKFSMKRFKSEVKIVVAEMGTIDFGAAASGETAIADLSGQVHQVPCCISFDGPAQVSNYFKPKSSEVEVDGVRTEEAHFRGRKLQGATISMPSGYSGFVLGQASNKNANGKRKACSDEEENPCWEAKAKFDEMTYWNHDTLPSKDDTILRSDVAEVRKACSDEEENPCWEAKAKFDEMTYWNHDTLPSKDDTILRSFHWFSIAEALHKPVTVEDLVAVTDGGM